MFLCHWIHFWVTLYFWHKDPTENHPTLPTCLTPDWFCHLLLYFKLEDTVQWRQQRPYFRGIRNIQLLNHKDYSTIGHDQSVHLLLHSNTLREGFNGKHQYFSVLITSLSRSFNCKRFYTQSVSTHNLHTIYPLSTHYLPTIYTVSTHSWWCARWRWLCCPRWSGSRTARSPSPGPAAAAGATQSPRQHIY